MKSSVIRNLFFEMLKNDGHDIVPSASLIPPPELGLLFTNAGMNQFYKYFSGEIIPKNKRMASIQKCLRVSGKHNDFDTVGFSPHHHTFFEMLGYFSFSDYFKKHAIELGWKFFVDILKIDPQRLYITVFKDDEESFEIWKNHIGIDGNRIFFMDKDNFWEMGETGPCGPSTEIIYDLKGKGVPTREELQDSYDYLELGNIVFTQYYKNENGKLENLPQKNVDTGLGMERIARVLQNTETNFETDLFFPIIQKLENKTGNKYRLNKNLQPAFRVVADHIRAITFLINDGVNPSNVGRGYIVRKLIRRGFLNLKKLGIDEPFLYNLVGKVEEIFKGVYDLSEKKIFIERVIFEEEERFIKLLNRGYKKYVEIKSALQNKEEKIISGDILFELYDTYGFPIDLVREMALDDNLKLDIKGFDYNMQKQKEKSRESLKKNLIPKTSLMPKTLFIGYSSLESNSTILHIFNEKLEEVDKLEKGEKGFIIVDKTPFYAESGGQIGDKGKIIGKGSIFIVEDTQKENDVFIHMGHVESGIIDKTNVKMEVDKKRRKNIAVHHTLTHLLQAALREVIGDHCHQAGSYVSNKELRFDFTHFKKLTGEEIKKVEDLVNDKIENGLSVKISETTYADAVRRGAMALFEGKYGDKVRLIEIEGFSLELCGGTHLNNTLEARGFKILQETSVSAGIRRMVAIGGEKYIETMNNNYELVDRIRKMIKSNDIEDNLEKQLEEIKQLQKENNNLQKELIQINIMKYVEENPIIYKLQDYIKFDLIRGIVDYLRNKYEDKVFLIYQIKNGKISLLLSRGDKISLDLMAFMKPLFSVIKGGGGGRSDFIQCGGSNPAGVKKVIDELKKRIK